MSKVVALYSADGNEYQSGKHDHSCFPEVPGQEAVQGTNEWRGKNWDIAEEQRSGHTGDTKKHRVCTVLRRGPHLILILSEWSFSIYARLERELIPYEPGMIDRTSCARDLELPRRFFAFNTEAYERSMRVKAKILMATHISQSKQRITDNPCR